MSTVNLNKLELFEIIRKCDYLINDEAIGETAKLIETHLEMKLIIPLSQTLKTEITSKLGAIKGHWTRLKSKHNRESFRKEIAKQIYKIHVNNADLVPDTLLAKYDACRKHYELTVNQNVKLESSIRELSSQLDQMSKKLFETESHLKVLATRREDLKKVIVTEERQQLKNTRKTIKNLLEQNDNLLHNSDKLVSSANKTLFDLITNNLNMNDIRMISSKTTNTNNTRTLDDLISVPASTSDATAASIEASSAESNDVSIDANWQPVMDTGEARRRDPAETTAKLLARYMKLKLRERRDRDREKKKARSTILHTLNKHSINLIKYTKRKSYYTVSTRQKNRLRKQIKHSISESTEFLKNMGLCLGSVDILPIELDECDFRMRIKPSTSELADSEHNKPNVNNLLYYKDKHSISDRAYNDLKTRCFLEVPSISFLKKRRAEIDNMFEIYNNEMGVFLSFEDKLRARLQHFFDHKYGIHYKNGEENSVPFTDNIIHIKLAADGTNIGRSLKLLNFTFTIINEGAKAKKAIGNYSLGIFEIENENHSSISACFKEIIDEIEQLKTIKVGKHTMQLIFYYACDWKMLAHSLGLLSANSKYPCVWCKCCKDDFHKTDTDYSIVDPNKGARNHEELSAIISHPEPKKIVKFGYDKKPIFRQVLPISRYMIDMLHLFLRISDSLFNLLIKDCSLADNFDMQAISKFDVSIYKHMNSLQHFLNQKCNVKFTFLWMQDTKKLTWRDLVGPEKVRLFENFNLAEIIPGHEKFNEVTSLWTEFYSIIQAIKLVEIEPADLKQRTNEWLKLYLTVYNKSTVTPYMHAFVAHLHEFVLLYKDINAFNCQGLEKLNDMSTGQYFKGTNKKDTALHQMLKKRNRMEYLSLFVNDDGD
jgi:hypothetical protein